MAFVPGSFEAYPGHSFQIHMTLMAASSRGELTLKSTDAAEHPRLLFNYLSDARDLATFREAIRLVRQLLEEPAISGYVGREIEPGEHLAADDALDGWIRKRVATAYHPSCTCKMGPASDPLAVVGPDLRVHGIDGLRIADASVMPAVVSANTNATCIMIGDRAADFMLGKAQLQPEAAPYWMPSDWATAQR